MSELEFDMEETEYQEWLIAHDEELRLLFEWSDIWDIQKMVGVIRKALWNRVVKKENRKQYVT